jgi:hypothetical protein
LKCFLIAAALAAAAITTPTLAADVGVSVTIGQPGFYGRIDIGDYPYPYPRVIYRQPRIVDRVYIEREPIYLRVPPGHAKNWRKHCHKYDACGERVYFVQDSWYEHEYVPYYQEYHHERRDDRWEDHREHEDDRRDNRKDDYHGDRRNEGPGNSQGHSNNGHGKNKGHGQNR